MSALPASSLRVGLAGEQNLHGPVRAVENTLQPLEIAQQQRRPLVSGEPPREPDGQRIRIEHFVGGIDFRLRRSAPLELNAQPPPRKRHQPLPAALVGAPQLLRGNRLRAPPQLGVGMLLAPFAAPGSGRRADSSRAKSTSGSGPRW